MSLSLSLCVCEHTYIHTHTHTYIQISMHPPTSKRELEFERQTGHKARQRVTRCAIRGGETCPSSSAAPCTMSSSAASPCDVTCPIHSFPSAYKHACVRTHTDTQHALDSFARGGEGKQVLARRHRGQMAPACLHTNSHTNLQAGKGARGSQRHLALAEIRKCE